MLLMPNGRPSLYDRYVQQALLVDEVGVEATGSKIAFLAVGHAASDWPFLVIAQRYTAHAVATDCGAVLLPETR